MNIPLVALARDELQQIRQDFSADPNWEGFDNRVVADGGPTIEQNFGWKSSDGSGQIGGTIWRSRTPAWYAMKVGPFTFNDKLSASGQIAVTPAKRVDGFYFGFFRIWIWKVGFGFGCFL